MTPALASRIIAVIRHAIRTARTADDAAEAQAVLDELEAEPTDAPAEAPAPVPLADLRASVQAENAQAEKKAYKRADVPKGE